MREVGKRVAQVVAVQQLAGDPVVVDVQRSGGIEMPRLERRREAHQEQERTEVPRVGIAQVHAQRLAAVVLDPRAQARADVIQRGVPVHLAEAAVGLALQRAQDAVGVVADAGERGALGADETLRLRMIRVAAQLEDLAVLHGGDQPARGLADASEDLLVDGGGGGQHGDAPGVADCAPLRARRPRSRVCPRMPRAQASSKLRQECHHNTRRTP